MPEEIVAIVIGGITMMIPIVFILTKHQQKMATILRQDQAQNNSPEVYRELAALREVVHQQTIAIDNLSRSQADMRAEIVRQDLHQRVS